jgi:ribosomal protein S18 acetylase RimI-like enzyme
MLTAASFIHGLTLRDANDHDHEFMEMLFRSTRKYLYQMDMPKQYVDVLISQQYRFQMASYRREYAQASVLIIQSVGEPIGRIIVHEDEAEIHVVDLCMAPGMRGKGYGTSVLCALQEIARKQQKRIWLSLDRQNQRAKKRYLALGFAVADVTDTNESMLWSPSTIEVTHP